MSSDILVVAEHERGQIADVTYELLGLGRSLAEAAGGQLIVLLLGSGISGAVDTLGAADLALVVDDPALAEFNPESYNAALASVVGTRGPRLVLVANTSMGMDLGAALSVSADIPLVAYAVAVTLEDGPAVATSQLYGGKIFAESVIEGDSGVISLLAGSNPADAGRKDGTPPTEAVEASVGAGKLRFAGLIEPQGGDVDITQQDLLVAVGRGIGSEDNLPMVETLAGALGGAVASSRPIVDSGWLPKTRQVGKSGVKVKPKIYLALGISGAPEHIEGMKDAELIIAVNTDETAPIFEYAHYGTTEDLEDIVEALQEKLD